MSGCVCTATLGSGSYRAKIKIKSGGFLRGRSALLLLGPGAVLMVQGGNVQISDAVFFPVELAGISHS